jgi:very-short-patch-repair endonuclease
MTRVLDIVLAQGGLAHITTLRAQGSSDAMVRLAVARGDVRRIRQGWFAVDSAPEALVNAVRIGGRLSCISVLRQRGIWCVDDHRLHLSTSRRRGRLTSPKGGVLGNPARWGVAVHTSALPRRDAARLVDTIDEALFHLFACQSRDDVIVSLDSALNKGLTTLTRLEALPLTDTYRSYLGLLDPTAQSGLETKARLRFRRRGIRCRSQVYIAGVGFVDLLIGDRLVIECDGITWHSSAKAHDEDCRRDLELHRLGYTVIRVTYRQVMFDWASIDEVVRGYVSRREHRWAGRHRRAGLATCAL